jgi:protein-S-isoprenylcysteine O-methyltransferase Ste14
MSGSTGSGSSVMKWSFSNAATRRKTAGSIETPDLCLLRQGAKLSSRVSPYRSIIAGLWLLFVAYWAVAAEGAKHSTGRRLWRGRIGLRLVVILLIATVLRSPSLREFLAETHRSASHSSLLGWTGVALCVLGFGFSIIARWHLGRTWGMPMSRKEQTELVTSGPYALIRHPIYTGLILAMVGSAIGVNISWALLLIPVGAYFIYSARREETVMLQLFPEQYAAYMAHRNARAASIPAALKRSDALRPSSPNHSSRRRPEGRGRRPSNSSWGEGAGVNQKSSKDIINQRLRSPESDGRAATAAWAPKELVEAGAPLLLRSSSRADLTSVRVTQRVRLSTQRTYYPHRSPLIYAHRIAGAELHRYVLCVPSLLVIN